MKIAIADRKYFAIIEKEFFLKRDTRTLIKVFFNAILIIQLNLGFAFAKSLNQKSVNPMSLVELKM